VPLSAWPIGESAVLAAEEAGDHDAQASPSGDRHRQLARLGLRPGMTVTPMMRTPGRGLVLAIGDLRLAVDRESAHALKVHAPGHTHPADRS
jgi:Fe2+ transport system protein FeoA